MQLLLALLGAVSSQRAFADEVKPLAQAHAHNDYAHQRPLLDALDHGFTSVEADIFLVDGALLVAHDRRDLKPERTLEALYLDPLRKRAQAHDGSIYGDGRPFHLLIDLKSDGKATYAALSKVLGGYSDIISSVHDGQVTQKAVNVTISGDRPLDVIAGESLRYAGIDGRWSDLDSDAPAHLIPLISDSWFSQFRWLGIGKFPDEQRKKLHEAVKKAHAQGRQFRLWAAPDFPAVWSELQAAGVDLINTDNLAGLEAYLREHPASN